MNIDRLFDAIAAGAWIIFFAVVGVSFILNWRRYSFWGAIARIVSIRSIVALVPPLIISLIAAAIVFIQPNEIGVVVSFLAQRGYREQPLTSGRHWVVPISEQVVIYSISRQTYTMSSNPLDGNEIGNDAIRARTSDGQEVMIDTSLIFSLNPERVVQLHITWQNRYVDELIRPLIRGQVRTLVAGFTVAEVNSIQRRDLETTLSESLRNELARQGLIVDQFLLRNVTFSDEFAASVEQKQIALEQATQSGYEADRIRNLAAGRADEIIAIANAQATAVVVEADAQAVALERIRAALAGDQDLLTYRYIDKLADNIRVILVPSDNPLVLPIPGLSDALPMMTGTPEASLFTPTPSPMPSPTPGR